MRFLRLTAAAFVLASAFAAVPALAQDSIDIEASVWDLELGTHASDLPADQFAEFACGTNGGPPSLPITGWTDYALCRAEEGTGWHEVYFQYDDLYEYVALAQRDLQRAALYGSTSVYSRPVIATALFDDDGFMRGLRLVTDPRVDLPTREEAYTLGGFLQARYDGDWVCEDLPVLEGEIEYRGRFIKKICRMEDPATGITRSVETHVYRRPGQTILNLDNTPTSGYFESLTRSEEILTGDIPDREARLAEIASRPPAEEDPLVVRARDCPGCDLSGANLRRANLAGANLAGANLEGASLHAAILTGANLAGANLNGANLNKAQLMLADLTGAQMVGVMLYEARLDGANLTGANMLSALAGHARLIRANMTEAVIGNADLTEVLMTNAIATDAIFYRSRLWNAQMSRTDFTGAIFAQADLLNAIMTEVSLVGADLRASRFTGVDLRDSDLTNADLSGAWLDNASLARTVLEGTNFTDARLPAGFTPP